MTLIIICSLEALVIGYLSRKLYQARTNLNKLENADYNRRNFGV